MEPNQIIRIRLRGYDHKLIDVAAKDIVFTARHTGAPVSGPIPLPRKRKYYTICVSPNADKDARGQFKFTVYKRMLDIHYPTDKTIDALMKLDLSAGVDVQISVDEEESK